jgi:hypothetical protein
MVLVTDLAEEYIRCNREKDAAGISRLFADDALRISFQGEVANGHAAVMDWYVNRDFKKNYNWRRIDGSPDESNTEGPPPIGSLRPLFPAVVDASRCVLELEVALNDGARYRAIDMFTLNSDGRISQLLVYRGPDVRVRDDSTV